jgi:hypothetical protein
MRRWFWVATGFGLGVAASRRLRKSDGATRPTSVSAGIARRVRRHVNDAVHEGRQEAQRRERALRDVFASTSKGTLEPEK